MNSRQEFKIVITCQRLRFYTISQVHTTNRYIVISTQVFPLILMVPMTSSNTFGREVASIVSGESVPAVDSARETRLGRLAASTGRLKASRSVGSCGTPVAASAGEA